MFSFQRDFAVGICNKISEMIQGMYILFGNVKRLIGILLIMVVHVY